MILGEIAAPSGNMLMAATCVAFAAAKMTRVSSLDQKLVALKEEKRKKMGEFGWLQRDVRIPLPTLAELEMSCHQIGMQDGMARYLCLEPANEDCVQSTAFSEHYEQPVFICASR